jgi:hypothetical protein
MATGSRTQGYWRMDSVLSQRRRFSLVTEEAMQSYLMRNNPIEATPEGCIAVLEAPL